MTECVVKKRAKAIDVTMSLHGMWASFTEGNDALAWVNRKGENVTQSQLAILRAAACSYDTRPIERPPEQHELVRRAVEHIVEEETRSIGGQLGAASGARRKTYARLKEYIDTIQPTLFPAPPELHSALEDIYKYPLQETARDTLNRQLRKAIKTKGHSPNEDAARKLIYLALNNAVPAWTRTRNWTAAQWYQRRATGIAGHRPACRQSPLPGP